MFDSSIISLDMCQSIVQWCSWKNCVFLCVFLWILLSCINRKIATELRKGTEWIIVKLIELLSSVFTIFGSKSKQMLLFIPKADQQFLKSWRDCIYMSNQRKGFYEISQDALSRYLMSTNTADLIDQLNSNGTGNEFDDKMCQMMSQLQNFNKESQITNLEVYRSSMSYLFDPFGVYHTFIVFNTTSGNNKEIWWSLEKTSEYIVMQRSQNKYAVVNRLKRKNRQRVKLISENKEGNGTMSDLLATMWAHNVIEEKYHIVKSSCQTFVQFMEKSFDQSFANFVGKRHAASFEPIVPYSSIYKKNAKLTEPFINLLTNFPKWKPLFAIVYLGDHVLLENILYNGSKDSKDNNVNLVDNGTTLLQLAILFSRTEMVDILLRHPDLNLTSAQNEDSDMPWKDMSIFHTAAAYTKETKILDLLKQKTDAVDQRTALHIAAMESNEITVNHLLKTESMDPNAKDNRGHSPLHLAAKHTYNTKIIDLILKAKKAHRNDRGIDDWDSDKKTALHHAVMGSNFTTARHLMKRGANPNHMDKDRSTPLELAAQQAKDMKIIDLFLNNKMVCKELKEKGGDQVYNAANKNKNAGLYNEIEHRLRSLGIIRKLPIPPKTDPSERTRTGSNADTTSKQKKKAKKAALEQKKLPVESKNESSWCSIL